MLQPVDFYDLLELRPDATPAEIRAAFLRAADKCHPDRDLRTSCNAQFKRIRWAYEVLSDARLRTIYDELPHAFSEYRTDPRTVRRRVSPAWPIVRSGASFGHAAAAARAVPSRRRYVPGTWGVLLLGIALLVVVAAAQRTLPYAGEVDAGEVGDGERMTLVRAASQDAQQSERLAVDTDHLHLVPTDADELASVAGGLARETVPPTVPRPPVAESSSIDPPRTASSAIAYEVDRFGVPAHVGLQRPDGDFSERDPWKYRHSPTSDAQVPGWLPQPAPGRAAGSNWAARGLPERGLPERGWKQPSWESTSRQAGYLPNAGVLPPLNAMDRTPFVARPPVVGLLQAVPGSAALELRPPNLTSQHGLTHSDLKSVPPPPVGWDDSDQGDPLP